MRLIPIEVDARGLMGALDDLARTTVERFDTACRFECPRPVSVDNDQVALHLFRIDAADSPPRRVQRFEHMDFIAFNLPHAAQAMAYEGECGVTDGRGQFCVRLKDGICVDRSGDPLQVRSAEILRREHF